jgi:hypothetical protein
VRSREQLELDPLAYQRAKARERQRALVEVLAILRRARERREPWYEWVLAHRRRRLASSGPGARRNRGVR